MPRAPVSFGQHQKTRGLWERDCWLIQELRVLVLTERHVGSGDEIEMCFGPQITIYSWVIVTTLSGEKW